MARRLASFEIEHVAILFEISSAESEIAEIAVFLADSDKRPSELFPSIRASEDKD